MTDEMLDALKSGASPLIAEFEANIERLTAERDAANVQVATLASENAALTTQNEALQRQIDELVNEALKPMPIFIEQTDQRDPRCGANKRHLSGCACTGELRGPITA